MQGFQFGVKDLSRGVDLCKRLCWVCRMDL